eukprot:scaffold8110_cov267-Pinguiococcus_pyrenoidosus.AAC.5
MASRCATSGPTSCSSPATSPASCSPSGSTVASTRASRCAAPVLPPSRCRASSAVRDALSPKRPHPNAFFMVLLFFVRPLVSHEGGAVHPRGGLQLRSAAGGDGELALSRRGQGLVQRHHGRGEVGGRGLPALQDWAPRGARPPERVPGGGQLSPEAAELRRRVPDDSCGHGAQVHVLPRAVSEAVRQLQLLHQRPEGADQQGGGRRPRARPHLQGLRRPVPLLLLRLAAHRGPRHQVRIPGGPGEGAPRAPEPDHGHRLALCPGQQLVRAGGGQEALVLHRPEILRVHGPGHRRRGQLSNHPARPVRCDPAPARALRRYRARRPHLQPRLGMAPDRELPRLLSGRPDPRVPHREELPQQRVVHVLPHRRPDPGQVRHEPGTAKLHRCQGLSPHLAPRLRGRRRV